MARRAKNDEFYTSLRDIEQELKHYAGHFEGKVVYCNCDDPRISNFFRYFSANFERLGLKKLIVTCYRGDGAGHSGPAVHLEYAGGKGWGGVPDVEINNLSGDGDFRSAESIALLEQADIVVTNPPFSLFREYVAQLFEYRKKFLILGNMNASTYNSIFPLFQGGEVWYGVRRGVMEFRVPDDGQSATVARFDDDGNKYARLNCVRWFTNLEHPGRREGLDLEMAYDPGAYPKYANFDAIEVGRVKHIPVDYDGLMGVPITFLDKYSPEQFDIIGCSKTLGRPVSEVAQKGTYANSGPCFYIPNGDGTFRAMYDRIVIRNRRLA